MRTAAIVPVALRLAAGAALLFSLSGCSVVDWFKSDNDKEKAKELEPVALVDFEPSLRIKKLWSTGTGNGQGKPYNRLQAALYGEAVYAASANGDVSAVDAATGKRRWHTDVDEDISGGVGVGGDLALVGTIKGDVIALDAASGREVWRVKVSSEVLAPPAADWDVVVVQTLDGKVTGLDASTGAKRWSQETQMPLLTLRGTAPPLLVEGVAYAALANGRIVAIKADNGMPMWEGRIAIPQGQSEIERAVDIEGRPLVVGSNLFAVSYQGKLGGISMQNGRPLWLRDASSYVGIAEGYGNIYVSETSGVFSAYEIDGGSLRWQNEELLRRGLSTPATLGSYVAVGDIEGYIHVLSQSDGHMMGRVRADSAGVRADLLARGDTLYVFDNDGGLSAYTVSPEQ